ncbi:multicopper oxidase family protein [Actinoalloteichus hymeniacidonis]|uniref:Multicopper oxidase n=1 Tax=Actinoalloteichus hymeniacidonis TaxID=340345 RepID=A0AAC9HST7_9PSEU|nr:multicopper oxidase domain-containing protein [Actinoalloteichus hymeniacidonis]AOS64720.1 putative multicopper oxidase [Actinoalloteichus hymeniacidonis]MBB5907204.1 FtsP/CotA-like multicopper oxidase with cupredoxin domain [Actinoalloteichus hymeniacidonis]
MAALFAGTLGAAGIYFLQARIDTVGAVDFDTELTIPPLAESEQDDSGARVFDLTIQSGATEFVAGGATDTWGVNGTFLGPTIRAQRGERVEFAVTNDVDEETSIHWHGMRLPAEMDGGPHQPIMPGETWRPHWTVDQPASTLWYHPHVHGKTAAHTYRGVAGMFILDDENTASLNLPADYGVDDIPLIVQDRKFDADNQFDDSIPLGSTSGTLGDEILVNGSHGPYREVTTRLVRLRLLNASNARMYNFGFSDDRPFQLIGTDGGLLPEAWETDRIQLSAGERAEIVVAFEPGDTVELRSYAAEFDLGDQTADRLSGEQDELDIVQFRAADALADETEIPETLAPAPDLGTENVAEVRTFDLEGRSINGQQMQMDRIDFGVREGDTEVWEVTNHNGYLHNFHVHDVQFQVVDVDGVEPPPQLRGWKDTVLLVPDLRYRLAMRFSDHTDPNVPYMFHCHLLTHEDEGMMGQFVVLGEDEEIGRVPQHGGHDHGD